MYECFNFLQKQRGLKKYESLFSFKVVKGSKILYMYLFDRDRQRRGCILVFAEGCKISSDAPGHTSASHGA